MKASFYLVMWIVICVCLLTSTSVFIHENIALITTLILGIFYWFISSRPSSQIFLLNERKLLYLHCLSTDTDQDSMVGERRLNATLIVKYVVNFILLISIILICMILLQYQVLDYWWGLTDWIGFTLFTVFSLQIILKCKPNTATFSEIDVKHYIDVGSYIPKKFNIFNRINSIFSIIAVLLGISIGGSGVYLFLTHKEPRAIGIASIFYLYGLLAIYFGIYDLFSSIQILKTAKR